MTTMDMPKQIHHGKNVKRFREMLDMKQEALAMELGGDWTQRKVSLLETKETIEPEILEEVAKALKVPVKAIESFDESTAVSYISTFNDNSKGDFNYQCNFNPLDKYVEAMEENKKLYERFLKEKDEKIALMERLLSEKK